MNCLASENDKKLSILSYHVKKRSFHFNNYVTLHKDQQNILEFFVEHGYKGIDDHSKEILGIEGVNNTSVNLVKLRIMSEKKMRLYLP